SPGAGRAAGTLGVARREVPAELAARLKKLSQAMGVPLRSVLLAAHLRVLSLVASTDEVLTGLVSNSRPEEDEGERVLGLFLNTLPLRVELADESWRELIQRVFAAERAGLPYRRYPAGRLKRAQREELFETAFNYNHFHVYQQLEGQVEVSRPRMFEYTNFTLMANFDLAPGGEGLTLRLNYDSGQLTPEEVQQWAGCYLRALETIAADVDSPVHHAALLSEAEQETVLEVFNRTAADYDLEGTLDALFEAQVDRTPEAAALVDEDRQLSYRKLDGHANQLAHALRGWGVGPDTVVGVMAYRSIDMVLGLYGVMKAGGAYLPLDPDYPQERVASILADSGVNVVLVQPGLEDRLGDWNGSRILLEEFSWREQSDGRPERLTGPENLAYVIYTSGSTGTPKGVAIEHAGIRNRLVWMQEAYALAPGDRVLQKTPYSFDVSVWEFFWPLISGATLVVARPGGHQDSRYLADLIQRRRITAIHFVPSMLRVFLEEEGLENCDCLRLVVTSGEALSYELAERVFERLPKARLENLYGPTEASVDVTRWSCMEDARRIVPIGRPIANTRTYVLSPRLEPLPIGVAGELHLAGVQLARGYLNRPELSAERFVPDPFGSQPGQRMYKTGDLCRWLADGSLEYLGRLDHQAKIRGNRIELGEIEAALRRRQEVREAVVVAREDGSGSKRLVAYVVLGDGADLAADRWQRELKSVLPEYMVPQAFVALESLPLSSNGKVDRRRLPAPDLIRPSLEAQYVAPRSEMEIVLATVWQQVLGIERVGVLDNFFALGGDSIKSIQVLALAKQRGLAFTLAELFQAQTVADLAVAARRGTSEQVRRTEPWSLVSAEDRMAMPDDVDDAYPLAELQAGMLFHSAYSPETAVYHDVFASRIHAELNEDLLRESVGRLMARHAVLRTSFALTGYREPLQLVHRQVKVPLDVIDLRHLSSAEQDQQLAAWLEAEKARAIDWTRAPLFRLVVHRLSGTSFELALSFHHAILDGWSVATMLAELFGIYDGLSRNESVRLLRLGLEYRDFVALEREAIGSEAAMAYWEGLLAGHTATRLPRLPGATREAGKLGVAAQEVPSELFGELKRLSQAMGVPLKSVLLAAHLRVLSLVAGTREVLTGLVSNSRPEEDEGERVLGLFLNTLPLRVELTDETWRESVRRVFAAERAGLAFRRYPAGRLKRFQREELFETAFNYNHFHVYQGLEGRVELSRPRMFEYTNFTLMSNFDLAPGGEGLSLRLNYDSGQLDPDEVRSWTGYYLKALEAIAADADAPVYAAELISPLERKAVVEDFNATAAEYDLSGTLDELFERQVDWTPEATALVYEDRRLSYRELDEGANRLARLLRRLGVGPDAVVGVMGYRSIELVEALYGVMKAGGAYLPLDPEYPQQRLASILADSGVEVVLVQPGLEDRLGDWPGLRLPLEESSWREQSNERLERLTGAKNLAYVIYTSGSTGVPKGVAVEHAGIRNRLVWMQEAYGLTASDRVLQKTPYSFDVSVWEFFWPLISGATLVVTRPGGHQDSGYLVELIRREEISVLHFVPSMLRVFLEEESLRDCTSLRLMVTSGEALPYSLAQRVYERLPGVALENLYGPTEASVDVTRWSCPAAGDPRRIVPIGRPIANTRTYVLSPQLEPLPVGVAGELHLAGVQLARGYLNRPDLSAERFVPDPLSSRPGQRMYRTGDLCRWLPDGSLEYLGRLDHQVKIRGNRIELGEIEAALRRKEEVREAVVVARDDTAGSRRLAAYVVLVDGAELVVDRWQRELKNVLPDYMVPQAFLALEALPLSPNGKVDRRRLPEPEVLRPQLEAQYVAPRNEAEAVLAMIWQEVLGIERVGVFDNFFALGGDSIKSIQVLARAQQRELSFNLAELFQAQTVADLALVARQGAGEQIQRTEPWSLVSAEDRAGLGEEFEDAYPLADLQAGMLFHSVYSPETAVYHDVFASRVRAELDEEILRESVRRLMARHAVLRTSFALSGHREPLQLVHREVPVSLEVIDLMHLGSTEQDRQLAAWLEEEKARAFDWTRPPLFRLVVHRLGGESFELALSFHHAILDGWSVATMLAELFGIYDSLRRSERPRLPGAGLKYRDFVALEREAIRSDEAKTYWEELLAGHTATRLPRVPGATPKAGALGVAQREVPAELAAGVRQLAQAMGVPLKSVLLAAHLRVLSLVAGTREVLTGLVSNSRPEEDDGERVLGLFLNTLPLRLRLDDASWRELIQRVFAAERAGLAFRRYPAGRLKRAQREELFETAFNYNHFHVYQGLEGQVEVSQPRMFEYTNFTLMANFDLAPGGDGLALRLNYDSGQLESGEVEHWADYYLRALGAAVADVDAPSGAAELISEQERKTVVSTFNATQSAYDLGGTLDELFEAQVGRTPEAPALVYEERELSYRELDGEANRLAHALRQRGIGPDAVVGVMAYRSIEMVVALYGVMKAGGAYLPLDPEYPQERLASILTDSRLDVVLVQPGLEDRLGDWSGMRLPLEESSWREQPNERPQRLTGPKNLAYVIYTSGSTGTPKGVAVEHAGIRNRLVWMQDAYGLTSADRVLQKTPYSFDVSVWEFFWPLITGATLVVARPGGHQDSRYLVDTIRQQAITTIHFVPSMLRVFLEEESLKDFASLRLVVTSGEALPYNLAQRVFDRLPQVRLENLYGPTE
ncbi:MAG: amino acid adenylation domain-containing protein, partial [Pirellulales bacterium]|nr:amino acid adenylation domain-containing protein [Pirellulales bacterium]